MQNTIDDKAYVEKINAAISEIINIVYHCYSIR